MYNERRHLLVASNRSQADISRSYQRESSNCCGFPS